MLVQEAMTTRVVTAAPTMTVPEVIDVMVRHDVRGLPVIDSHLEVLGFISETDLVARHAFAESQPPARSNVARAAGRTRNRSRRKGAGRIVAEIMSTPAVVAFPYETLREASARMVSLGVTRLPVLDLDDRLVGIISEHDIVRASQRSDDRLQADIEHALAKPSRRPKGSAVSVSVLNGIVTLRGTARDAADVMRLEAIARDVPGVVDVTCEIAAG